MHRINAMANHLKLFISILFALNLHKECASFSNNLPTFKNKGTHFSSSALKSTLQTEKSNQKELSYNWKNQWYALTYTSYILNPSKTAESVPASVFGHPLVLWREEDNGPIFCADDICPHRSAALSEGRVRDGKLECLYHGWQFKAETNGSCVTIPQLAKGSTIPKRACLKMRTTKEVEGILWVWMGEDVPSMDPPKDGNLDDSGKKKGFIVNDFQIDLPYDHSYLVENLIDPAHIPISHDRTSGGGKRESAQAYEMEIDEDSISSSGFTGRYRNTIPNKKGTTPPWIETEFEAPGIVRYKSKFGKIQFRGALHCMPLAAGRCRLLFRAYFGYIPLIARLFFKIKPKWAENLNSCKILEQDVGLITTQEDHFARNTDGSITTELNENYLILQSSDTFVRAYRSWLDKVGHGMPWYQGLVSSSPNFYSYISKYSTLQPGLNEANHRASGDTSMETRYHRHVRQCPTTRQALENIQKVKKVCTGLSASTISIGLIQIFSDVAFLSLLRYKYALLVACPLFSLGAAICHKLESKFYLSVQRKNQLRTLKGI